MKIYTKTGDGGETSLFGGGRVRKDAARIAAYGTVDELNSILGVVVSFSDDESLNRVVGGIQTDLFTLGADLATPTNVTLSTVVRVGEEHYTKLEKLIDGFEEELDPLKQFILPGGSSCAALLHLARTVCRRAEREVVHCAQSEEINTSVAVYLNRLSDLLFVLARIVNKRSNVDDIPWNALRKK
jgi:cob(I)alamin adenosyltransferase